MGEWIKAQDLAVPGLLDIAPGQATTDKSPDRDFFLQAEEGLPVGIRHPLPRTPHVFEEQTKWPLDKEPWEPGLLWVPNYGSASDHLDFAKEKFEEEIREGMLEKISMKEFESRYGEHRAIAATAAIVEDEEKGKKRLIHDATHGVRVNHWIKCRDKIRAPGAREKKQLLLEMIDKNQIAFSVVGDISKAHRRFKHCEDEHGYLACQLEGYDSDSHVYVNKVGTFGVNCARYWWTRISAAGLRATHHLIGPCPLGYAPLRRRSGVPGGYQGRARWHRPQLLRLVCHGISFQVGYKTRGGFRVEWLGMETEYSSYRLGLTEKRLVSWLRDKMGAGNVAATEMRPPGLCRLGETILGPAICVVLCYSGKTWTDEDPSSA